MSEREPSSRLRRLLAIDAAGAALTAAITLGLLASGVVQSGVPSVVWWVLGGVAVGMAAVGALALWRQSPPVPRLRKLAFANLAYALASLIAVWAFRDTVTFIAAAYVMVEALVLVILASVEWRESSRVG
ncbi:hypothetical protein [Silanimonas sp.]|uniref:hypothetical protein n=1 Tax=Silanimonas sp. TaxID=1929290 RepID=UPI0022C61A29|nr:hypothetical protein [Silanimonas sp.]MCZ8062508.1 hypothetical protein [Silanimonas sp.]